MIYTHVLNRGGQGVQSPADMWACDPPARLVPVRPPARRQGMPARPLSASRY